MISMQTFRRLALATALPLLFAMGCGGRDIALDIVTNSATGNSGAGGSAGGAGESAGNGVGAAGGAAGSSTGIAGSAGGIGGSGPLPSSDKVDVLLMIDNSSSMADKEDVLATTVADLVDRLVTPACVDPSTDTSLGPASADGMCAKGELDFPAVTDLHIGIISSSLGSHGATTSNGQEVCPDPDASRTNVHNKDMAHLLNRTLVNGVEGTAPEAARGFLAWDATAGAAVSSSIIAPFQSMVVGVGQHGCGYESQLEAIYRFLVDPNPYATLRLVGRSDANPGAIQPTGTDITLLQQRRDFLRADSIVLIVAITDENDCSINDNDPQGFFALLPPVSAQQGQISQLRGGNSICQTNPNDKCCVNCGTVSPPAGCPSPFDDAFCQVNQVLTSEQDPVNLRCFNQKQRYGKDFLFPVQRYVQGLTAAQITARDGTSVANPLFTDLGCTIGPSGTAACTGAASKRDPRLVFMAGIIGVPWQDIAVDPANLANGYKSTAELSLENVWATIVGDPDNAQGPVVPLDFHMVESTAPRPGLAGIASISTADPINGHEWNTSADGPPYSDLQYACVFDLITPKMCVPTDFDCDCNDGTANQGGTVVDMHNPLCQDTATNAYGHLQFRGKAYPGVRELQVLKGLGDQAVVASICPSTVAPAASGRPDFGYRPAISAIIRQMRPALRQRSR
jgi:hypothetical protein